MPEKTRLILYGNGKMAELVLGQMAGDARYQVCAVAADAPHVTGSSFRGLPQMTVEEAAQRFPPGDFAMLVAVGYRRMRSRREMFLRAKGLGYRLINYIGPGARVHDDLKLGENVIVFEMAYLGPMGRIGSNVIVRPQAYVGHDFAIGDHAFISAGAVLGGRGQIGELSFVGLSATVLDGVTVADECLIAAGALVVKNTEPSGLYLGQPARRVREFADTGVTVGE